MKTVTFEQKMSNTGSIHDTESDMHDRVIKFREGEKYAVVLAAYYGGKGYRTAQTAERALELSMGWAKEYSHIVIDDEGNRIDRYDLQRLAGW